MGGRMINYTDLKMAIDPRCSRLETLAMLGSLSPQVLSSDEVRELAALAMVLFEKEKALKEHKQTDRDVFVANPE